MVSVCYVLLNVIYMCFQSSLEELVIKKVGNVKAFNSLSFAAETEYPHTQVVGVLKSLAGDAFVILDQQEDRFYELTDEALLYAKSGSPEIQLLKLITEKGTIDAKEATSHPLGFRQCMKNKWLKKAGSTFTPTVDVNELTDELSQKLNVIIAKNGAEDALPAEALKELNKRKLLKLISKKYYNVSKGGSWSAERKKQATTLTKEMMESGSWENETFKPVNWNAVGLKPQGKLYTRLRLLKYYSWLFASLAISSNGVQKDLNRHGV